MIPGAIIQSAGEDGVNITLSNTGTIKLIGDTATVNKWVPVVRQSKPEIIAELKRELRRTKVLAKLAANPEIIRAVLVDADTDANNVIVTVAVRLANQTCEVLIPKNKYDPWLLLDLLDKHVYGTH